MPLGPVLSVLLSLSLLLFGPVAGALALSAADLPALPPASHVFDDSEVLSRASNAEIERLLESFSADQVDARLITVPRLDYGLDLKTFGQDLLKRWSAPPSPDGQKTEPLLLLLIDTQNKATAVVAEPPLDRQLPDELLRSTAATTMALPVRNGDRYRQAGVEALQRFATVLGGGDDPGEPVVQEPVAVVSNIPSKEETSGSNAFTWVVVLLVVGSVVPMLTWWVFSR